MGGNDTPGGVGSPEELVTGAGRYPMAVLQGVRGVFRTLANRSSFVRI
jgi:hypothetical protein